MRLITTAVQFDYLTFLWCQQRKRQPLLAAFARQVSRSADGHLYVLIGLIAWAESHYLILKLGVLAFALERSAYFVLKQWVRRDRPPEAIPGFKSVIQASDKFSFPSGHTSAAFLMATLLVGHFPQVLFFVYPWACAVAWSRVTLGVHFPSDTLAGATLGTSIALLGPGLLDSFPA
ncbi:phosphatase PAP2 family protein [Gilvimarinus sp. F26214L]|uniref:phosphatase PAP2 family protein n=1 Tax=Gilvimarinus sp. DZF01 TaxID=3461371 RepID=UPI004045426C